MIKLQTLKCPSCNANIEVDKNQLIYKCIYCGSTIILNDEDSVSIDGFKGQKYYKKYLEKLLCLNRFRYMEDLALDYINDYPYEYIAYYYYFLAITDNLKYKIKLSKKETEYNKLIKEYDRILFIFNKTCSLVNDEKSISDMNKYIYEFIDEGLPLLKKFERNNIFKKIIEVIIFSIIVILILFIKIKALI